jgi:acyl-CoA oxidase
MRRALAPGADQFGIFNGAQDHLLVAARAHVDRIVFDSFAAAVDRTTDAGVRDLLTDVLRLYALTVIENDRAFFIEHSYLTPGRAKAVTQAVNALCGRLRPHARTLVDGFGIPERWLDCPLLDACSVERRAERPGLSGLRPARRAPAARRGCGCRSTPAARRGGW